MPEFAKLKNDLILRAALGEKVERPPIWIMVCSGDEERLMGYKVLIQQKGDQEYTEVVKYF